MARPARVVRLLLAALTLLAPASSLAMDLIVAGEQVPGLSLEVVPGISYAPASGLAAALGASLAADSRIASVSLAGSTVRLGVFAEAALAARGGSVVLDGTPVAEAPGALLLNGVLWLPVKVVVEAFGGYVTVMTRSNEVVATMPQPRLTELAFTRVSGTERVTATLSALTPYSVYFNEALSTLHIRFSGADSRVGGQEVAGRALGRGHVVEREGTAELLLELERGTVWTIAPTRRSTGFELTVTLEPAGTAVASQAGPDRPAGQQFLARMVIDTGGGELAGRLAGLLAADLASAGVEVILNTAPDGASSPDETGASLVLQLGISTVAGVYVLGEAAGPADLEFARSRSASPEATDELRRALLLGGSTGPAPGREFAEAISQSLDGLAGLAIGRPRTVPLAQLVPAGGRGVLLELQPASAADPSVVAALAAASVRALTSR